MYVITGVTGNTGSVAAQTLLDQGKAVRVVVRSEDKGRAWAERGAEVAVAALEDADALARAFRGAEGAYVLSPPDPQAVDLIGDRKRMFQAVSRAIGASKLPHVVLLSSIGAQRASGTGPIALLHDAESQLSSATALTSIRAGSFLENFAAMLPIAKADGVLPSFVPASLRVPTVSVVDIGRVAAEALVAGPRERRILELGGPTDPSANDIAEALSALFGRPVAVAEQPLAAVVPTFTSFGMSKEMAELYREMLGAISDGTVSWEGGSAENVRGRVTVREGLARLTGG
jgi:uncharacterized protein YbjT (DUF2867 family)